MARYRNKIFRRAVFVLHHGLTDARFVRKMLPGVSEERRDGFFALQGFDKSFRWLRKDGLLSALAHHLIGVPRKYRQNFRTVRGREVRSARANCNLPLAGSAACAKIFEDFRAEGFHPMPALNLSGPALLYRRLREFQRAAWRDRSIPATPRRNRPRSLQTVGWRKSAGFVLREVRRQAAACRQRGCARVWRRQGKLAERG